MNIVSVRWLPAVAGVVLSTAAWPSAAVAQPTVSSYQRAAPGAAPAAGEAPVCAEDFDHVDRLYGEDGWLRFNTSALPTDWPAPTARRWDQGSIHSGAVTGVPGSSITAEYVADNHGTASVWAVTPPIDFGAGNRLSFWTRSLPAQSGNFLNPTPAPDRLFVRVCTAMPCLDVGADEAAVGDFTTAVLAINENLAWPEQSDGWPAYPFYWSRYQIDDLPMSGTGRIAFHYHVPNYWWPDFATWPNWGSNGTQVNIDAVELQGAARCPFRHNRLFGAGFEPTAPMLTQSVDPRTITHPLNIGCALQPTSYLRRFDLAGVPVLSGVATDTIEVASVEVGIELARKNQHIKTTLYTIPDGAPLTYANLTPIGSARTQVSISDSGALKNLPVAGLIETSAGTPVAVDLVVEVTAEDGLEFLLGANSAGQTAPSFLAASGCGNPEPTDLATGDFGGGVNYPDIHLIMTVNFEDPADPGT
ncbi:choice-of-anchor J domain-containing protein [Dokdonella koreensis]|uniref:Peptidase families S8 and S53 subfamily n=1 Tax=Dokdonella koreensis DS-123 TaxID=1300342 RepID=A0A167HAK3_9GAMM|nr:choice-of-anchor J domain-containing protein [Dokdonella koreensis]ANB19741.1 Peptidase families S8 and S53 subfamily [Dokdonella koreensis DS-123]